MRFSLWTPTPYRATGDLDLLGYGDAAPERIATVFRKICRFEVEHGGVAFKPETLQAEPARAEDEYSGVRVIMTASTSGIRYTGAPQVVDASAKAAIIQFSRVVALEYAPNRVRVNTVVPGQLHTPMVEARLAGRRAGGDADALLASRLKRIPLGCVGYEPDTANAALFLASGEARFTTGPRSSSMAA